MATKQIKNKRTNVDTLKAKHKRITQKTTLKNT